MHWRIARLSLLAVVVCSPATLPIAQASAETPARASRPDEAEHARGAAVLAPFKRELMQALKAGLAEGPVEAVAACRVRAPEIADGISKDGVRVGRTSDRLRNPANVAPDWVRPLLAGYRDDPADRVPKSASLPSGRTGYVEPIMVKSLCLTCHGETLAPEVGGQIRALYPNDRAVGYRVGDLRGVFWAELPDAG